jgi:hypothetical protein
VRDGHWDVPEAFFLVCEMPSYGERDAFFWWMIYFWNEKLVSTATELRDLYHSTTAMEL